MGIEVIAGLISFAALIVVWAFAPAPAAKTFEAPAPVAQREALA